MLSGALALISTEMGGATSVSVCRSGRLEGRMQCLLWGEYIQHSDECDYNAMQL